MSVLNALLWKPTPSLLYRDIGGAKQLCSEFRFQIEPIGKSGELGFIEFDSAGRITVQPGYVWDGASGPTIDTSDTICASLGHDVMYELMRAGLLPADKFKHVADLWFYERLKTDGMDGLRAWVWYRGVVICGAPSTRPENAPVIRRAPVPFPANVPTDFTPIPGYRLPGLSA